MRSDVNSDKFNYLIEDGTECADITEITEIISSSRQVINETLSDLESEINSNLNSVIVFNDETGKKDILLQLLEFFHSKKKGLIGDRKYYFL